MTQKKIDHMFKAMSEKDKENNKKMKAGLPINLYDEVMAISPPSTNRRPLTKPQRANVQKTLALNEHLVISLTGDLEAVAENLASMNPRSSYRMKMKDVHSRLVSRLAEANAMVTSSRLAILRDDEDRNVWAAFQFQRQEIEDYEENRNSCREPRPTLKLRPTHDLQSQPGTSAMAKASRASSARSQPPPPKNDPWPLISDFDATPKKECHSPDLIQPSPATPNAITYPCGSRCSKSSLARTLTPGLQRKRYVKKHSSTSSSSDDQTHKRLTRKQQKLSEAIDVKIEEEAAEMKPSKNVKKLNKVPPPKTYDKRPSPLPDHRYGYIYGLEPSSPLGGPQMEEDDGAFCRINCDYFRANYVCDHMLPRNRYHPNMCPIFCFEFGQAGSCPHEIEQPPLEQPQYIKDEPSNSDNKIKKETEEE